jgi:hypothetical protein
LALIKQEDGYYGTIINDNAQNYVKGNSEWTSSPEQAEKSDIPTENSGTTEEFEDEGRAWQGRAVFCGSIVRMD